MWFSESEDSTITDIVEAVNSLRASSNRLLVAMTRYLVKELLKTLNIAIPSYIDVLEKDEQMEVSFSLFLLHRTWWASRSRALPLL